MSLVVRKVFRVYCSICEWTKSYAHEEDIPKVCPVCGGNKGAYNKVWAERKEEIHNRLGSYSIGR